MKYLASLALLVTMLTSSSLVSAHTVQYSATLSGAAEVPANASPGTGSALLTIDLDLLTMDVSASFSGLIGTAAAAHIHCCTSTPGALVNVGVATPTPTFPGFPLGVTSGTYQQVFDLSLASSYNPGFIAANGGTVGGALNTFLLGLDQGKAYFNLHTSSFGGGEIRGFLTPVAPVPLPGAALLLLSGLGGLGFMKRRGLLRK